MALADTSPACSGSASEPITRADDVELRDNVHGLLVWAIATLITAFLLLAATSASTKLAAPSGGMAGPATSVAGENIIAYDIDRLLRGDRRADTDVTATRAEVARILLTASGHSGVAADDRSLSRANGQLPNRSLGAGCRATG